MYIAQTNLMGSPRWAIRESYPDQKGYRFRNLMILRRQPWALFWLFRKSLRRFSIAIAVACNDIDAT